MKAPAESLSKPLSQPKSIDSGPTCIAVQGSQNILKCSVAMHSVWGTDLLGMLQKTLEIKQASWLVFLQILHQRY
jgi:hypothetical protein